MKGYKKMFFTQLLVKTSFSFIRITSANIINKTTVIHTRNLPSYKNSRKTFICLQGSLTKYLSSMLSFFAFGFLFLSSALSNGLFNSQSPLLTISQNELYFFFFSFDL